MRGHRIIRGSVRDTIVNLLVVSICIALVLIWTIYSKRKESRDKLDLYFKTNTNFRERYNQFKKHNLFDTEVWLNNCIFKNKSLDEVSEFQICAQCQGTDMLFYNAPYMVCGEAMDEVANLLSNKTLDILNRFWADNVDLPPELEEIFSGKRLLLV